MADKAMKVTYGDYVIESDEKGSISVTKGGMTCNNAKGALREIAQLVNFEVDPDWTSRQFGSKLMKFISECECVPQTNVLKETQTSNKQEKSSSEKQESSEQPYVADGIDNSEEFNQSLRSFYNEWRSYSNAQYNELLHNAEKGDVIAQFKYGYILSECSQVKNYLENYHLSEEEKKRQQDYLTINYEKIYGDAYKWLKAAAEQGLGLAMYTLANYLITCEPYLQLVEACTWIEKCKQVNPWRGNAMGLYANFWEAQSHLREYYQIKNSEKQLEGTREREKSWIERYDEMKGKYNERVQVVEEKIARIKELEEQLKAKEERIQKLLERNSDLLASSASSSSSGEKMVNVRVSVSTGGWFPKSNTFKMTQSEYKSLLNGPAKNRISFAKAHCIELLIANPNVIKEVTVELE